SYKRIFGRFRGRRAGALISLRSTSAQYCAAPSYRGKGRTMSDPLSSGVRSQRGMVRLLFAIFSLCFLGAAFNHARDIWEGGFLPYRHDPLPFNVYWTSLAFLDALAVVLLWTWPRAGLVLAVLIMVSDVA